MILDNYYFLTVYPKTQILKETFSRGEHTDSFTKPFIWSQTRINMPYEQAQSLGKGEKKKASLLYKSSRLAGVCLAMGNLYIPDAPMAIMCENIQNPNSSNQAI